MSDSPKPEEQRYVSVPAAIPWHCRMALLLMGALVMVAGCHQQVSVPDTSPGATTQGWLYPVLVEGKWGYIDRTGVLRIEPTFEDANAFQPGQEYSIAVLSEQVVMIDRRGSVVAKSRGGISVSPPGRACLCPEEGHSARLVRVPDGITLATFEEITGFSQGLLVVRRDGKWGYANSDGEMVIQARYDNAFAFSDGLAAVMSGGKWGFIDKSGKWVIKPRYDNVRPFSDGLGGVRQEKIFWYIDKIGAKAFDAIYDFGDIFSEGVAVVRISEYSFAYIDKQGKYILGPGRLSLQRFSEGLGAVSVRNEDNGSVLKAGYVDKQGKFVIRLPRDVKEMGQFQGGLAHVELPDKWGYIDRKGKWVWQRD